jgi:hypothetical protein
MIPFSFQDYDWMQHPRAFGALIEVIIARRNLE